MQHLKKEIPEAPALLVQPGFDPAVTADPSTEMPIGLAGIAVSCEKQGISTDVFDFQVQTDEEFSRRISRPELKIVGMTSSTMQIYVAARLASKIRQIRPDLKIALGGFHATNLPRETAEKFPQFDFIASGEGEYLWCELVRAVIDDGDLSQISGLIYRQGERIESAGPRPRIKDLNALPHPDRSLFFIDRYNPNFSAYRRRPGSGIITSRGCPYRCTYCSVGNAYDHTYRYASPEWIFDEVQHCIKDHGIRDIYFYDDTFNVPQKRVFELCELFLKNDVKFSWTCYARADHMDEALLRIMKKAGCFQLRYGFEVGSDLWLKKIGKTKFTLESIRAINELTQKAGLETYSNFMMNLPGQSEQDSIDTIEFARSLALDSFSFSFFYPYPGSALSEQVFAEGQIEKYQWQYQNFNLAGLISGYKPQPSQNEGPVRHDKKWAEKMYRRAYVRSITNPRWILRKFQQLITQPKTALRFFYNGASRFFFRFVLHHFRTRS